MPTRIFSLTWVYPPNLILGAFGEVLEPMELQELDLSQLALPSTILRGRGLGLVQPRSLRCLCADPKPLAHAGRALAASA